MIEFDYIYDWETEEDNFRKVLDERAGYRYIHYDAELDNGTFYLLAYDKSGPASFKIYNFQLHLWHRTEVEAPMKDSFGHYIIQESFKTNKDKRRWVNKFKPNPKLASKIEKETYQRNQIICNDTPEDEFMKTVFIKSGLENDFNKAPLRIFYIDIETEISATFMPAWQADNRINMITIKDSKTDKFYTWSLQKCDPSEFNDDLHIVYDNFFDDEKLMLSHFLKFWIDNYPDIVCGWNSRDFDMPYIMVRCKKILGEVLTRQFSPFDTYSIRHAREDDLTQKEDDKGKPLFGRDGEPIMIHKDKNEIEYVTIPGISQLDELLLYRDKFGVHNALDGGYGLSNVGIAEGLGSKVTYETTLKDLYLHDWQKFYVYNVRDVDLLFEIEKKCKLIPLARSITGFGMCNCEAIYQSSGYLINTLAIYTLKRRTRTIFYTYSNHYAEERPYEGAFVFPPVPGRYAKGIACVDFNSLYPSCIRAMNLSPETYIGRLYFDAEGSDPNDYPNQGKVWNENGGLDGLKDGELYTFIYDRNDTPRREKQVTKADIKKMLETKALICAPNSTFFFKHEVKRGIVADWAGEFYNWRKSVKKEMAKLSMDIYEKRITDPKEIAETETRIQNLTDLQQAIKICLNSVYGLCGLTSCCLYNPSIVQSVTRLGRFCNQNGAKMFRKWLDDTYNVPEDYITNASGDTDSIFLNVEAVSNDFIKKYNLDEDLCKWPDDKKLELFGFIQGYVDDNLIPKIQDLIHTKCYSNEVYMMRYGLEYLASGGVYEAKKHYGCHKIVNEGPEIVDKFKFTGVEIKKATIPPEIKKFLKEIYCRAILDNTFTDSDMRAELAKIYETVSKMSPEELGKWCGYKSERKMEGFLQPELGSTGTSKAVGFYNQIITDMGLGKKYDTIELGSKIQTIYIKGSNKYGIDTIAFQPRTWPKEFNEVFEIDYEKMFDSLIMKPMDKFFIAMKFNDSKKFNPAATASLAWDIDDI